LWQRRGAGHSLPPPRPLRLSAGMAPQGFWEPHTASHDFCEENYRFTGLVAELLNSLSSLPIAWIGAWAWACTPVPYRAWPRFALCFLSFISIGLGSAAFHATLRRPAQALDEVPMVLANLVFVFCLSRPTSDWAHKLASALSISGVILVVIYVIFEAYVVFLSVYGIVVVYLMAVSYLHAYRRPAILSENTQVLRRLWKLGFGVYAFGFALWVTDHAVCAQLGVGHLHIAWHALACMGTLFFVLLLLALTVDEDSTQVNMCWRRCLGIPLMPYLELGTQDGASSNGDAGNAKKQS